jgi:hypothetical protein
MHKVLNKVMERLRPATSAAAGCAPACDTVTKSSGGQIYKVTCCYRSNCSRYCY